MYACDCAALGGVRPDEALAATALVSNLCSPRPRQAGTGRDQIERAAYRSPRAGGRERWLAQPNVAESRLPACGIRVWGTRCRLPTSVTASSHLQQFAVKRWTRERAAKSGLRVQRPHELPGNESEGDGIANWQALWLSGFRSSPDSAQQGPPGRGVTASRGSEFHLPQSQHDESHPHSSP